MHDTTNAAVSEMQSVKRQPYLYVCPGYSCKHVQRESEYREVIYCRECSKKLLYLGEDPDPIVNTGGALDLSKTDIPLRPEGGIKAVPGFGVVETGTCSRCSSKADVLSLGPKANGFSLCRICFGAVVGTWFSNELERKMEMRLAEGDPK